MLFQDRKSELSALAELSDAAGGLAIIWGRRRIGKTRLLLEWCERERGVYTVADQSSAETQRAYFARAIADVFTVLRDGRSVAHGPIASASNETLVAHMDMRGKSRGGAELTSIVDLDPYAEQPTFNVDMKVAALIGRVQQAVRDRAQGQPREAVATAGAHDREQRAHRGPAQGVDRVVPVHPLLLDEAALETELRRDLHRKPEQRSQHALTGIAIRRGGPGQVRERNHQGVHRGLRIDVVKRHRVLRASDFLRRDFPCSDSAKNAVAHDSLRGRWLATTAAAASAAVSKRSRSRASRTG